MRDETEWVETVSNGWNILVGANEHKIMDAIKNFNPTRERLSYFGEGNAAQLMIEPILNHKNPRS